MPEYDFHQLSSHDLELLTRDLLQAEWGVTIENFKKGRDGGIDLRYAAADGNTIVQCKHFVGTGYAGLLRELRAEVKKVDLLKPDRYVVVTSVALSPDNKTEILRVFQPWIRTADGVIGADGLNNLLGLHPEVEKAHFKLWLASRAVLDRVLKNASTQSEFKARQVYGKRAGMCKPARISYSRNSGRERGCNRCRAAWSRQDNAGEPASLRTP